MRELISTEIFDGDPRIRVANTNSVDKLGRLLASLTFRHDVYAVSTVLGTDQRCMTLFCSPIPPITLTTIILASPFGDLDTMSASPAFTIPHTTRLVFSTGNRQFYEKRLITRMTFKPKQCLPHNYSNSAQ